MGKSDRGDVHANNLQFKVGKLLKVKAGQNNGLAFIATGSLVRTALDIAHSSFTNAAVWSAPFIKPMDAMQVASICKESSAVVVFEEHSVLGGLGSTVAEIASEKMPTRILRIGVQDRFSQYCGSYEYLLKEHGLDRKTIEDRIADFQRGL